MLSRRTLSSACASTPSIFSSTLPSRDVRADTELHHLADLGDDGHLRAEILDLDVDLVDLDDRDVDQHVLFVIGQILRIDDRVVLELRPGLRFVG